MSEEFDLAAFFDDIESFYGAQCEAEQAGKQEFKCPLCGGNAWRSRADSNGHLHCGCYDCGFKITM